MLAVVGMEKGLLGKHPGGSLLQGGEFPAVPILYDCNGYCKWGVSFAKGIEWEFAARGGKIYNNIHGGMKILKW